MEESENFSLNEEPVLIVDEQAKSYLRESAKWAKIIAIILFISIVLIIIVGIGMLSFNSLASQIGNDMGDMDPELSSGMYLGFFTFISSFISFFYIAYGLIMLYPALKLYQFSEKTQTAIIRNDKDVLNSALENHKSYFKFTGIMLLVMIGISIIGLILMSVFMASALI